MDLTIVSIAAHLLTAKAEGEKSLFPSQLNFAVPSSPALDVLGVSANKAKAPSSLQELTLGLVNSFDEGGHLKQGFAFAGTLGKIGLTPKFVYGKDYYNDFMTRLKSTTNLSFAAVRGTGDDKSSRISAGVALPLIDRTDWRQSNASREAYGAIVTDAIDTLNTPTRFVPDQGWGSTLPDVAAMIAALESLEQNSTIKKDIETLKKLEGLVRANAIDEANKIIDDGDDLFDRVQSTVLGPRIDKASKKLIERLNDTCWNKEKLDIAFAQTWFAEDAAKNGLRTDGSYIWATYQNALGKKAKFSAFGRYASHDRSFDKDAKAWSTGNSRTFGASVKYGDANSGFFLEYQAKDFDGFGKGKKRQAIWQGGFETKFGGEHWLQIALGSGSGVGVSKNILGINLAFNLSPTREIEVKK